MKAKRTGKRSWIISILVLIISLAIYNCSEENKIYPPYPGSGDTLEFTFQDGLKPFPDYQGTKDAVLKSAQKNQNFGDLAEDTIGVTVETGNYNEFRLIISFDLSMIESCLEVVESYLTINLSRLSGSEPITLTLHQVSSPALTGTTWLEGTGGFGNGVSWLTIDGGAPWKTEGGDFLPDVLSNATVQGDTTVSFSLPGNMVLNWIKNPSENQGVILIPSAPLTSLFRVNMKESPQPNERPSLYLKYIKGG